MKRICAAILAFVLLSGLTGCSSGRDALASLDDITDEMLVSGELGYEQWQWAGRQINDAFQVTWEKMTGTDTCMTLTYPEETAVTLTYTVTDAGEGFRLALVLPDDTVVTLAEGDNPVTLPAGDTDVVLAAYKTGGAFSLEVA